MVKEIVQHGHCHSCGRAIKYGDKTCSDACEGAWDKQQKSRKRMMWIMYAMLAFFVLTLLAPALFGGR